MKKYQSNIFRQTVAMLLMVWAVMCVGASDVWAQTYTLTSSEGTTVTNDVTTTNITVNVTSNDWKAYSLFYSDGTRVGVDKNENTYVYENVSLNEGANVLSLYRSDWNGNKSGDPLATLTVTRSSTPPVSFTLTSSKGESVDNDVSTTTITVTVANNSGDTRYCLYKGDEKKGYSFSSSSTDIDVDLDEGDNTFSVYKYERPNKVGSALASITVNRASPPPTPTGNEAFTVKGSSDGVFDFDANGGTIQNATIDYRGLNPNATYYLVKSTDTDPDNPRRNPITPSSTGTASSHVDISNGLILYLKIDDGTGKPGETVASMKFSQASSLVINSSDKPVPAGGSVCSGSNVVVDAQYVGDTYDLSNWSVTGADGL
ncbi:MAG: hypothetical protein II852_11160, partial [Bacteroidales bacterium]|nr:hypothetical protein [Bacteroidales bacterium]